MIICINQLFQSREHSLHPRCAEGRTDRQKEGQTGRQRDRQPMLAAGAVICPLAGCQTAPGLPVAAWRALRSTAPPYRPLAVAPRHSGGAPSRPLAAAARHRTTLKARRSALPLSHREAHDNPETHSTHSHYSYIETKLYSGFDLKFHDSFAAQTAVCQIKYNKAYCQHVVILVH